MTRAALWAVACGLIPVAHAGIAPIPHDDDTTGPFESRPAPGVRPGFQPLAALSTPSLPEILSRPDTAVPYRWNEDLLAIDSAAERALFASPPAPSPPRVRIITRGAPPPTWATPAGWTPPAERPTPVEWTPPVPKMMRPYPFAVPAAATEDLWRRMGFAATAPPGGTPPANDPGPDASLATAMALFAAALMLIAVSAWPFIRARRRRGESGASGPGIEFRSGTLRSRI